MKKMMLLIITFIMLSIPPYALSGSGGDLANCHNIIEKRTVSPGVVHVFVDKTCDMIADIVMEYRNINGKFVYTGNWWWL